MARQFVFVAASLWLCSATFPGIASAGIIGTTGAIMEIAPPPSVELDALESNLRIFAFTEMLGLTLGKDIAVDITSAGSYSEPGDLTPGSIAATTVVDVYFLHFDPVTGLVNLSGSITFDQDIVGVIVLSDSLDATDRTLGFPGTTYPTGLTTRGLEFGGDFSDFITLSEDLSTISIDRSATTGVDQIRIITAVANFYTDPAEFEAALLETNKRAKASWNFKPNNLPPASVVALDDPLNIDTHGADPDDPWSNPPVTPSGDCCVAHPTPGCEDPVCETAICAADPFCCDNTWDGICADAAAVNPACDCVRQEANKWPPSVDNVTFQSNLGPNPQAPLPNPSGPDGLAFASDGYLGIPNNILVANTFVDSFDILSGPPTGTVPDKMYKIPVPPGEGVIPDDDPIGVSHEFTVPDSGIITDLNLDLSITHTWVGDLCVILEKKTGDGAGISVAVIQRPGAVVKGDPCHFGGPFGCAEDNYLTIILDDEGTGGSIEDACTADLTSPPNYVPNNPLSAFDGIDKLGTWSITVIDNAAADFGTLNQWSLNFLNVGGAPDNHTAMSMEIISSLGGVGPILVTVYDKNEVPLGTIELNNPPPPPNNDCADRELIEQDVLTLFDTSEATTDGPSPCGLMGDIWYNFTPAQTFVYDISLCGSSYDTVLAVYDGCACPADTANEIACNDDFCGSQSQVKVHLAGGQCYKIQVGGFSTDAGLGQILISKQNPTGCDDPLSGDCCIANGTPGCERKECCVAICAIDPFCCDTAWDSICAGEAVADPVNCPQCLNNDDCAGRTPIEQDVPTAFDTTGTTTDGPETCGIMGQDIWYNFTPAQSLTYDISLCGSSYDTVLTVYDGCACPADPLDEIACNDQFCGDQSQVKVDLIGGQCYKIRVGGFKGAQGTGFLTITKQVPGECVGGTCKGGFPSCGGVGVGGCFCITQPDGSGACASNIFCDDATPCPEGTCPPGFVCAIETCCVDPVCVPVCGSALLAPPPPGTRTAFGIAGDRAASPGGYADRGAKGKAKRQDAFADRAARQAAMSRDRALAPQAVRGGTVAAKKAAMRKAAKGGGKGGALTDRAGTGGVAGETRKLFLGIIVKGDRTIGRVNIYDTTDGAEGISKITVYSDSPGVANTDISGPLGPGFPDGCVDAFDLGTLLGAWCSAFGDPDPPGDVDPPCESCTSPNANLADLSGPDGAPDGCVDAFDLSKLLADWCSALPLGSNPCGTCF